MNLALSIQRHRPDTWPEHENPVSHTAIISAGMLGSLNEQLQKNATCTRRSSLMRCKNHRPAMNSRVCFPVYLKNNRRGPFLLTWNSQSFNSPSRVLQTVPKAPWPQSRKPGQRHLAKGLDQRSGGESWCLTRRVMVSQALNLPVSWFPPRHSYLTE